MVSDESVVDTYMTDYLLAFFEKTPNYWQRCKTIIRGIDPNSRSIIVDVQYKTIDFAKEEHAHAGCNVIIQLVVSNVHMLTCHTQIYTQYVIRDENICSQYILISITWNWS